MLDVSLVCLLSIGRFMPETFDPYREWLGICAPSPNHYQLLGLPEFEADTARIVAAADARMAQVRTYQTGPRGQYTQPILNAMAAAKLCLLDPAARSAYNAELLAQRQRASLTAPPVASPPVAVRPVIQDKSGKVSNARSGSSWSRWWPMAVAFVSVVIAAVATSVVMMGTGSETKQQVQAPPKATSPVATAKVDPDVLPEPLPVDRLPRVAAQANGDWAFLPATARPSGGVEVKQQGEDAVLESWQGDEAAVRWKFTLEKPAVYLVQFIYTAQEPDEAQWELAALGENAKRREILTSEPAGALVTDEFYWKISQPGEQELTLRAVKLPAAAKLQLQSLRLLKQTTKGGR